MGNICLIPIAIDHWAAVVILTWKKNRIPRILLIDDRWDVSLEAETIAMDLGGWIGFLQGEGKRPFLTEGTGCTGTEGVGPCYMHASPRVLIHHISLTGSSKLGDLIYNILWNEMEKNQMKARKENLF